MARNEPASRFSSLTSSSTDSAQSTSTVKPNPATPTAATSSLSSRRAAPTKLKTDDDGNIVDRSFKESDAQISPTSTPVSRLTLSPSSTNSNGSSFRDHRMSDLTNYRRDLAVLDSAANRAPPPQQQNPAAAAAGGSSMQQVAPWMSTGNGSISGPSPSAGAVPTSFYNDSSDNLSTASQLSPPFRPSISRQAQTPGSNDSSEAYFNDERRPSVASVTTTASSQASKYSDKRGGLRKLQGFFGEEFPGKDSSETSLPPSTTGKEHRSHSYSHNRPHRDRNYSNATDHGRDASPSSSRPRTPVPAPEVVPFLYQEAEDIARFGEAPIRGVLAGPDRQRFMSESSAQVPPKTSSSSRSGHSVVHIPGRTHRHNKSNEDPRALRPSVSREDSTVSIPPTKGNGSTMFGGRSRAQSPTPSGHSGASYFTARHGTVDGATSPGGHQKRGFLGRLRRSKDKDEPPSTTSQLKKMPSTISRQPSRQEFPKADPALPYGQAWAEFVNPQGLQAEYNRQATFNNKFPFAKKGSRSHRYHDDADELIGPKDRTQEGGTVYHLDTNLSDMEGILSRPLPLTPMEPGALLKKPEAERRPSEQPGPNGAWNAPDSWAVRRTAEEAVSSVPETEEEVGTPPRPEEKMTPYCIRVFRSDGTFATLQMALDASVRDVIGQIVKKSYVTEGLDNYHIVLKKHDLVRILSPAERPLLIQKRLLQQVGYEERDKIEEIGREDNGYLCRFLFLSSRESDFHAITHDIGFGRMQKYNHVDLSGRNIVTIPISLYSKAPEIITLNLSRNLSLDLPRDFIQSCQNLRDIKYNYNEARKLPPSFSRASRLTFLDVSNNRLESLEHAELHGLTGLLKLNLANNRLKYLPPYFGAYKALRTLNLSSNFLEKFPSFLCDLESLVDLDMSFNLVSSFPDTIGSLRNMERFVVTNNRLTGSVPESFKNLQNLRELDVKYNAISSIDAISELPKLEILTADHNAISQFIGRFERLRALKLNANPITKFDITSPVPTLKLLNLSNAQLASIDDTFNNVPNLERLILDRNYFVSLPNQLGNLRRLEHFSIANNSVGELPPEIGCLTELKVLDVRGNNIRKLPMDIWWANKLETLNASSNVLENFPKPASRPPQPPSDSSVSQGSLSGRGGTAGSRSQSPSSDDLLPDGSRRPSQASSTLLSVGPSPVPAGPDRKSSVVSVYGKGGRKTSVVSRATSQGGPGTATPATTTAPGSRKDSSLLTRLTNTFSGSLRNLYLADNQLDDDVFDQLILLGELRVLNLSYNDLTDMPQRSIKSWPQLVELYLSGNELTSLPADDLEEYSLLQVLHINSNKFTNLPADISRAKKLAVLDCGSNYLKYNISNVPYDWNWNLNPDLRYLNLSGNRRLEIKQTLYGAGAASREQYTDFSRLLNLRVLGLMDVTLTEPNIPDQSEDRRVRTSGSLAGYLPYGMADTMGKNEHLSTIDLVVPRFNSSETETLLGLFDGQALSSGGSKIAKYLHENFGHIFSAELKGLRTKPNDTPEDALRRAFLSLNKDLVTIATQHTEERSLSTHRGSAQPLVLSKEDLNSGGVATVAYLQGQELYVANVGDVQAMLIQSDGSHKMLTRKHDPAEPTERARIRDAGGWVSRNGRLNDLLDVSRAFGYVDLMPAVQAAPNVSHVTIREQDENVIIATKELWEYLSPGLVVDIARSERGDLMRASQKIRDLAMAYGASGKIMVMMISVADLKKRTERSRLHRGQSMSLNPTIATDENLPARRPRRPKGEVLDSTLQRLEAEVPAPTGMIAIVFTDIKNSTNLWETYPAAMRSAIRLHNEAMRRQLRLIGGFEVKTEGDAFMVSFPTATSALLWCFAVQMQLLDITWPSEMLNSVSCQPTYDKDNNLIFRGLSVRMGIHWGEPLCEPDPITRRMDYYGPMVNKASRISAVADGGQITVSSDFISEIQRCLETYQESTPGADETYDDDSFGQAIRKELRSLSSQGFEVKEMGERKLKGLENPELVYSLYPHALVGRIEAHQAHDRQVEVPAKPSSTGSADRDFTFNPEQIVALWNVSLRLEMICSSLEDVPNRGLQPPETELLERMKQRGPDYSDQFLLNFMEHQVSRIETCTATLALRHMLRGGAPIASLNDLRIPMADVLSSLASELQELQQYRRKYGPLHSVEELEGSDTEQE
ncbi:Adenylate cyclase [Pleurostoma richardsiae]|uniref:Adenylate cyclase n=1 Tax=Pleurostoma richardsiae TaxID=41990 RepID=A0AA38VL56_9PEZI|nr:Adenylate cyclase [Pleurostoma richardsiae]